MLSGRWFGWSCALLWRLTPAAGTTIVVIRTPQEVVIAADSSATVQGDGRRATTETVCKIYELRSNLFFAVSGLVNDSVTGFNIPEIVAAHSIGENIAEQLSNVERSVQTATLQEIPRLKLRDPAGCATLIGSTGAVTVMFAGIEGGSPVSRSFSLGLAASPDGSIEANVIWESCPGNCPSGVRAFWFGECSAIERMRAKGGLPSIGLPDLARY